MKYYTKKILNKKELIRYIIKKLNLASSSILLNIFNLLNKSDYIFLKYKNDKFIITKYKQLDPEESKHIVVGVYYELPNKKIAYIFRAHSIKRQVYYYFDDNKGSRKENYLNTKKWKIRNDLNDFPNARDPKLPYVFDLYWGLKYTSQLEKLIKEKSFIWLEKKGVIKALKDTNLYKKYFKNGKYSKTTI